MPYEGTYHSQPAPRQFERRGTDFADQRDAMVARFIKFLETSLFILILFHFSGATNGILFPPTEDGLVEESATARLLWFPVYGLILILLLKNMMHFIRLSILNPVLIICVLWSGISYFWSIDPSLTMRRSVALLMTTVMGLVFAARYDWNGMIQRLAFAFFIMAIVAFLFTIINPDQGIMKVIHPGAWSGPWGEKNYLGGQMTKGLIACLCAFAMQPKRIWLWGPACLLCFTLVLLSTSKTALLISLFSILSFTAIWLFRKFPLIRFPLLYLVLAAFITFGVLMATIPDDMLGLIGKDTTFTGRTDIWNELVRAVKQKPWLGYGYGTFWDDQLGPSYTLRSICLLYTSPSPRDA